MVSDGSAEPSKVIASGRGNISEVEAMSRAKVCANGPYVGRGEGTPCRRSGSRRAVLRRGLPRAVRSSARRTELPSSVRAARSTCPGATALQCDRMRCVWLSYAVFRDVRRPRMTSEIGQLGRLWGAPSLDVRLLANRGGASVRIGPAHALGRRPLRARQATHQEDRNHAKGEART
jgi:hypothetical protein